MKPTYQDIQRAAKDHGLIVMGTLMPDDQVGTLVLLGAGPAFWPHFRTAPEAKDNAPDPVDRWSMRVIGKMAEIFAAKGVFPFGGPPYAPFIAWAEQSGRAFKSPVGMLVHDTVGLMISYRGALQFDCVLDVPVAQVNSPCVTCQTRPCAQSCPVGALAGNQPYDLAACHAYLDTEAGQDCLTNGCNVRRACPVSDGAGRQPAQSAHHMKAFHPK